MTSRKRHHYLVKMKGATGSKPFRRRAVWMTPLVVVTVVLQTIYIAQSNLLGESGTESTTIEYSPSHHHRQPFSVLLVTYVFGEDAVRKRYLEVFAETARRSGVDLVIVGDPVPPFVNKLAPNVRHLHVSWASVVDRVQRVVFDGNDPTELRKAQPYKVIDLKPLFAVLFPEIVEGYDWWGHVDNDMVLGNLRTFLTPQLLATNDILGGIEEFKTWGPFTLYRNTDIVNTLYTRSEKPMEQILNTTEPKTFDEWHHMGHIRKPKAQRKYFSSMSGIVERYADQLGLRWTGGVIRFGYDGECPKEEKTKQRCEEYVLRRTKDDSQVLVASDDSCLKKRELEASLCHEEVALSHFIKAKRTSLEPSLAVEGVMKSIMNRGEFRVNHQDGFTVL